MKEAGLGEAIFAAMGESFFTLSIGIGALAIFGSYIGKEKRLTGEAISITLLDTSVAFMSGLIIFPACFAYGIEPTSGPCPLSSLPFQMYLTIWQGDSCGALCSLYL